MEPHTSSYLSKYFVKLFRLHTWRRADYTDDRVTITSLALTLAWCVLSALRIKSAVEPKTLSHPWRLFKLAWSRSPCTFPAKSSLVCKNLSSQKLRLHDKNLWITVKLCTKGLKHLSERKSHIYGVQLF